MSKFTPGPWSHRNGRIFQTDYEQLTIANVARAFDGDYSPANGELLADAPALLDALEMFVNNSSIQTNYPDYCEFAEKLIAKHRPEKPEV